MVVRMIVIGVVTYKNMMQWIQDFIHRTMDSVCDPDCCMHSSELYFAFDICTFIFWLLKKKQEKQGFFQRGRGQI